MTGKAERTHRGGKAEKELSDDALLEREECERREYLRLERDETLQRTATFRGLAASKALTHAWELWWKTMVLARARGLRLRRHTS